ncbi:MAG: hypothetical protein HRJ53_03035 [Acidobacteria bacterium Pan2503]|uniref:Uncharacterized protein n=1 Tax=Candidatus Acidiferrum panamense TaxID=2741543 RepID=A0A7V8NM92_9BACT|nr:hypothetical protein [Candidatus Acidoferrum panamensis]
MTDEFFPAIDKMSDVDKLRIVRELVRNMTDDFKGEVMKQLNLSGPQPDGDLRIYITSNEQAVRVDFGAQVRWIGFPKTRGIQFAMTILEHCGARFEPAAPRPEDDGGGNPVNSEDK